MFLHCFARAQLCGGSFACKLLCIHSTLITKVNSCINLNYCITTIMFYLSKIRGILTLIFFVPVSQFILPPGQFAPNGWLAPRGATCPGISYPPPWLPSPLGGNISRLVYLAPGGEVKPAGLSCPPPMNLEQ